MRGLASIVIALVATAACIDAGDDAPKTSAPAGQATPTTTDEIAENRVPVPSGPARANLTGCAGSRVSIYVPRNAAEQAMPAPLEAKEIVPFLSPLVGDFLECEKTSVNGTDIGKTEFHILYLLVQTPPGRVPRSGFGYAYVVDLAADNAPLQGFLGLSARQVSNYSISIASTPSSDFVASNIKVKDLGGTLYEASFENPVDRSSATNLPAFVFSADPESPILAGALSGAFSSSSYGGVGMWRSDSPIARISPTKENSEAIGGLFAGTNSLEWSQE